MNQDADALFKIFRAGEWAAFQASGLFSGSPDDRRDGFIHLSRGDQLAGTLARHFSAAGGGLEDGLVCARLELGADAALRWEASRGGAMFPHLYRPLRMADVAGVVAPVDRAGDQEQPAICGSAPD